MAEQNDASGENDNEIEDLKKSAEVKNKEIAELHQISESLVDKDLKFSKSWMQAYA